MKKSSLDRVARRPEVLLVEFFSRGGLVHYTLQLARALAAEARPGAGVALLTAPRIEAPPPPGLRLLPELWTWNPHHRPSLLPRRLVRAWRGLRYVFAWMQVLRAVRREQPALVLLSDLEHHCDAWFLPRLRRLCHAQHPPAALADIWHNLEPFQRNHKRRVLRRPGWRAPMARHLDAVFVHGEALAEQFRALTGCRASVIPHGNQQWIAEQAAADPRLDEKLNLRRGQPLALLFGALSPYKGVDVLLAAMAALPPRLRPDLLIAGMPTAGADLRGWRRQARAQALEAWLHWDLRYVPTPDIAWYFRRADWVVLPYRAASQSGVAHLALTFGKPLLVTATGSLPELIDGNGAIVPPDDPAALAKAMATLANSAELRRQWGRRSAELAISRHAWEPIARSILAVAAPDLLPAQRGIATIARPYAAVRGGITEPEV